MDNAFECMQHALSLAKKGKYLVSPNPLVGCVITKNHKIIGEGWHKKVGENHAEINAILNVKARFGDNYLELLKGSTVYTTLEPCSTQGKTGACSSILINSKIAKIVIASRDKSQNSIKKLLDVGIEVEEADHTLQYEAHELNKGFFSRITKGRPFITCKVGLSNDGGIALENKESKWITCEESRKDVHNLRAQNDVIYTGIGTILSDNPELTARNMDTQEFNQPLRCIIDAQNKMIGTEKVFNNKAKTLIFCEKTPKEQKLSVKYIESNSKNSQLNLSETMMWLGKRNLNTVLVESGPGIIKSLIHENLIDQFIFYVAPKILGKGRINFLDFIRKEPKLGKIELIMKVIKPIGKDLKITAIPIYS